MRFVGVAGSRSNPNPNRAFVIVWVLTECPWRWVAIEAVVDGVSVCWLRLSLIFLETTEPSVYTIKALGDLVEVAIKTRTMLGGAYA